MEKKEKKEERSEETRSWRSRRRRSGRRESLSTTTEEAARGYTAVVVGTMDQGGGLKNGSKKLPRGGRTLMPAPPKTDIRDVWLVLLFGPLYSLTACHLPDGL